MRRPRIGYLAGRAGVEAALVLVDLLLDADGGATACTAALAMRVHGRVDGDRGGARDAPTTRSRRASSRARAHAPARDATAALVAALAIAERLRAQGGRRRRLAALGTRGGARGARARGADDPDPEVRTICALLLVQ